MHPILLTLPLLVCLGACTDHATDASASGQPSPADRNEATTSPHATNAGTSKEIPSRFLGRYADDNAACALPGDESHLQLHPRKIAFHENSGEVVEVRVNGDEVTITANLSDERGTWASTSNFRIEDEGGVIRDTDYDMRRVRCPEG